MDNQEKQEEKNKWVAWIGSIAIQLVMFLLFYFIIAWSAPSPPIPEYGIELGFMSSAGAPTKTSSPPIKTNNPVNEQQEESSENETNEVDDTANTEESEISEAEAPDPIEESETPVSNQSASSSTQTDTESEATSENQTASESENVEELENESIEEEQPKLDERAIYGSQGTDSGGNEGASLSLSGWMWDFKPKPDDKSNETGKIVYKIVVDNDGYLVQISTITSTVSPAIERKYRQAVERLTFSKTSDYQSAPLSTGTLTFIIKAR